MHGPVQIKGVCLCDCFISVFGPRLGPRKNPAGTIRLCSSAARPSAVGVVLALDRASDGSPWDLSGVAGAEAAGEAAGPEGDGSEALASLLRQINALYPNRSTGRQDGIQVEHGRKALTLTDDTDPHVGARMPSFAALVAALQRDARFDRAQTLEPGFWNSIERPYLRIFTREGPASDDGRPWDLSGLRGVA